MTSRSGRAWRAGATAWPPSASSTRTVRLTGIGAQISNFLAGAEGNDATHGIVGGDADGHAVAGHHFDAEPAHTATQLCQHLMALVALHAVETAAVNRHDSTLYIDEIVLAQLLLNPFNQRLCHIMPWFRKHIRRWKVAGRPRRA